MLWDLRYWARLTSSGSDDELCFQGKSVPNLSLFSVGESATFRLFPNATQKGSRFKGWGPGVQQVTSDRG